MQKIYKILLVVGTFLGSTNSFSQVLVTGDIAFTGYNSSVGDDFSFIILRSGGLNAGTSINFTDCGWNGGACGTNSWIATNGTTENEIAWTTTVPLAYGTQIRIAGLTANSGTVTGTALSLSSLGDQVFAFQGPRTGPYTMLAGIHMNYIGGVTGAANWDNDATPPVNTTDSNLPTCLTNGTFALFITNAAGTAEVDNAVLACAGAISNNPATARAYINNQANWTKQDATDFTIPPSCIILAAQSLSFTGKNKISYTELSWEAENEDNLLSYSLERSYDNNNFTSIATITPRGGTGSNRYTQVDNDAWRTGAAIIYYRLRKNSTAGSFSYSSIVTIKAAKGNSFVVNDLANPFTNAIDFTVTLGAKGKLSLRLTDMHGKVVLLKEQQVQSGDNHIRLAQTGSLSPGLYILDVIFNEQERQSFKLVRGQ